MNDFFKKILKESSIDVPAPFPESFFRYFPEAINVEWHKSDGTYEAIFYEDNIEKIASFNPDGSLKELKVNITVDQLPFSVKTVAMDRGELMNAIRIHKENKLLFEIIYRNRNLQRYLMLLTEKGKIIWEELL